MNRTSSRYSSRLDKYATVSTGGPGRNRNVRPGQGRYDPKPAFSRWKVAILVGAALLVFLLIGSVLTANAGRTAAPQVSVGLQLDRNSVAGIQDISDIVTEVAEKHAAEGGGTLTAYKGAGQKPVEIGRADLRVTREGNLETDPGLRNQAIQSSIDQIITKASTTTVSGDGRDVLSLLQAIAQDRPAAGQPWDVIIYSFGLPTVDPADARILMAADPAQAVESLPQAAFPDLEGATVQWVFPAATGSQEPLNHRTTLWRNAFLQKLLERSKAVLSRTVDRNMPGVADPNSPVAPAVANLKDLTPTPPASPEPQKPMVTTLDAGALFEADSTTLLDKESAVHGLKQLVDAWKGGNYSSIECVGRVAAFGSPEIGMRLSGQRAEVIVGLLAEAGVPATARGAGSQEPLPGDPKGPQQRSVTCTAMPR